MKKLRVSIANYSDKQLNYLNKVIDEYRSYKNYEVDINIHSTILIGRNDVKTTLHDASGKMVYFHRQEFIDCRNDYDLYLYSENDMLIKEDTMDTFVKYSKILPIDHALSFIRYEKINNEGEMYFPDLWPHVGHVKSPWYVINETPYFILTNPHQCYWLLTKESLNHSIDNTNFLINGDPGTETASTGVYEGWPHGGANGVIKRVWTLNKDDLMKCFVHHLPNWHCIHPTISKTLASFSVLEKSVNLIS